MMCCATSWIAVNYRLHCESILEDRLQGVASTSEAQALGAELSDGAVIRQIVLEVARPIYKSKRVINTDNFYTSVQLLQALKLNGLFGRGTVRGSSKHFPKHVMLEKGFVPEASTAKGCLWITKY
ncbi:unnamed protein product [Phytophthora fragariaefolia]|uniref:Unnamed protein product n=1 Tax=Phytophthora fragariaefolia TaxID=1490495 RepID=A0A9W6Y594_9STRA|nr:unnamed protein product [Phytophthora fragariaefolia]